MELASQADAFLRVLNVSAVFYDLEEFEEEKQDEDKREPQKRDVYSMRELFHFTLVWQLWILQDSFKENCQFTLCKY